MNRKPLVYIIAFLSALGGLLFGYDTGIISGAILFIRKDFALTSREIEIVVSVILIGAIVGASLAGFLADVAGRKKIIIGSALLFSIGALISAFAPDKGTLIFGRLILGLAIGFASMTVPLYISEISPPDIRGFLVSLNQVMITFGILASYLVALLLASSHNWRLMFGLALIPAALLGIGMIFLPESPRWLVKYGFKEKAEKILSRLHTAKTAEFEMGQIQESLKVQIAQKYSLFQKVLAFPLLIGIGLAVFQQITGINTVIYYAPMIFEMTGLSSDIRLILATTGVGLVNFLVTLVAIRLIDKWGRRALLLIGLVGMILSLGLLGASFKWIAPSPLLGWLTVFNLVIYVSAFAIGLGPIFWLLIAEIYPLSIRGKAMSLATVVNWGSNFLVSVTFLTLIGHFGSAYTFWFYGIITIGCLIFTYLFVPETKGKTLEQIEMSWKK